MDINTAHPHLAATIAGFLARSPATHHGVRIVSDASEAVQGNVLAPSRRWDDGNVTDETLPGTSVLYLDGDLDADGVRRVLNLARSYTGTHLLLVAARSQADGACDDEGERLLVSPTVVGVIAL